MLDFKTIIWDFDGVIIFSNSVREDGFRGIFKSHGPELIERLIDFHRMNGGLSRYVKIRYFYEKLLNKPITDEKVKELAEEFSLIQKAKLANKSLLNQDWLTFMGEKGDRYEHHIASGSDGEELRGLCNELGISQYFMSINGSPTPKNQLVKDIIEHRGLDKSEVVLIGDAGNDFDAAEANGISFRGYNNAELKGKGVYITALADL